jgi:hypothetical protein
MGALVVGHIVVQSWKYIRENRLGNPEKEKTDGAIQRNWQQWGFKTVNEDRKTRHGKLKI